MCLAGLPQKAALVESLKGIRAAKVFITHSERMLDQVDRVLRIEGGRLVEDARAPGAGRRIPSRA